MDKNQENGNSDDMKEASIFLKLKSLFRTIYQSVSNRQKKTLLPVMTAHAIYGRCKNQELITLFNKQAFCIVYKRMKQEWLELAQ